MSDFIMPDVEGWLTAAEGECLARYAAGKTVLEIGTYYGLSTICMARTAQVVYAVDTFDGRACPAPHCTIMQLWHNLTRYKIHNVRLCIGKSEEVLPQFVYLYDSYPKDDKLVLEYRGLLDLIFIDGAHDETSVLQDAQLAYKALSPTGLLAFHDYRFDSPGWPSTDPQHEVSLAVNQIIQKGATIIEHVDSLAIVQLANNLKF